MSGDCLTGKSVGLAVGACPAPFAKIFLFFRNANQAICSPSCPTEGRLEIVTDAGQDAVDADALIDEQH